MAENNTARKRSELFFDGRHPKTQLGLHRERNGIIGRSTRRSVQWATPSRILVYVPSVILEPVRSPIDRFLCLRAASQDDKAGVGYVRPICLDLALVIRVIFSGRSRSNLSLERGKEQRKH